MCFQDGTLKRFDFNIAKASWSREPKRERQNDLLPAAEIGGAGWVIDLIPGLVPHYCKGLT